MRPQERAARGPSWAQACSVFTRVSFTCTAHVTLTTARERRPPRACSRMRWVAQTMCSQRLWRLRAGHGTQAGAGFSPGGSFPGFSLKAAEFLATEVNCLKPTEVKS